MPVPGGLILWNSIEPTAPSPSESPFRASAMKSFQAVRESLRLRASNPALIAGESEASGSDPACEGGGTLARCAPAGGVTSLPGRFAGGIYPVVRRDASLASSGVGPVAAALSRIHVTACPAELVAITVSLLRKW